MHLGFRGLRRSRELISTLTFRVREKVSRVEKKLISFRWWKMTFGCDVREFREMTSRDGPAGQHSSAVAS
jgi:hypothetical protein